jgi:hypothetical protein
VPSITTESRRLTPPLPTPEIVGVSFTWGSTGEERRIELSPDGYILTETDFISDPDYVDSCRGVYPRPSLWDTITTLLTGFETFEHGYPGLVGDSGWTLEISTAASSPAQRVFMRSARPDRFEPPAEAPEPLRQAFLTLQGLLDATRC